MKVRAISFILLALSNACVLERMSSLTWSATVVAIVRCKPWWLWEKKRCRGDQVMNLLKDRIMCRWVFYSESDSTTGR